MEDESFHVDVLTFSILEELADVWTGKEFSELLAEMEFGSTDGMSQSELREMCLLALQDLEPEEAAALVLKYRLGDRLSKGQISNIAADMSEENPWEEYANMALHEQLFNVSSLLYMAFPSIFPEPDAVRATVRIRALHEAGRKILQCALNESFLIRLLAAGMDDNATLRRLFDEQLAGNSFPEAEFIIWTFRTESMTDDTCTVEVISSGSWLDPLRSTRSYSAHAYPDAEIGRCRPPRVV
ncbi:MAG: hypothetical protein WBM80_07665 [Woeseiaceae bacterium]